MNITKKDSKCVITLSVLEDTFAICKLNTSSFDFLEACRSTKATFFLAQTSDELSLVCPEMLIPAEYTHCDKGWCALKIQGVLDFSLIGILSGISVVLAENKIGIFVVSTYNTDYILIKEAQKEAAIAALSAKGYKFL